MKLLNCVQRIVQYLTSWPQMWSLQRECFRLRIVLGMHQTLNLSFVCCQTLVLQWGHAAKDTVIKLIFELVFQTSCLLGPWQKTLVQYDVLEFYQGRKSLYNPYLNLWLSRYLSRLQTYLFSNFGAVIFIMN